MSDEQLRIAVAEAMGEIRVLNKKDYPNSRDACASFEATLTEQQQATYALFLHQSSKRSKADHLGRDFDCITAKPRQRCLAYLATVAPAKLK